MDLAHFKQPAIDAYITAFFQDLGNSGQFYCSNDKVPDNRHFWLQAAQAEVLVDAVQVFPHNLAYERVLHKLVTKLLEWYETSNWVCPNTFNDDVLGAALATLGTGLGYKGWRLGLAR